MGGLPAKNFGFDCVISVWIFLPVGPMIMVLEQKNLEGIP